MNHLDDLAVVDVAASGAITAVNKIEKSQQAADMDIFKASYFYTEHAGVRYFAFANLGKGSYEENVLVKLAADGKQTREVISTTKDAEITIRPKDCLVWQGKKMLLYGNKNNRYVRWLSREL